MAWVRCSGGTKKTPTVDLIDELSSLSWTEGSTGDVSAHSLSFANDSIVTTAQLKAYGSGNSYWWQSSNFALSGQSKVVITNNYTTAGSNPQGLTPYIDVICNGVVVQTLTGNNSFAEITLPSNATNIAIRIRSAMINGSGQTWPTITTTVTQIALM